MTGLGGRPPAPLIPFREWSKLGRWWPTPARPAGAAAAVVVHHTVTATSRFPKQDAQHVERVIYGRRWSARFSSLPYNYLLHFDGTILEGRGVNYRNAANKATRPGVNLSNGNTLSVALIGDHRAGRDVVTPAQRRSFAWLTTQLAADGHLGNAASVTSHAALAFTECPAGGLDGLRIPATDADIGDDREIMHTIVSTTNGEAWVCAAGRARPISNVTQWLDTFTGPIIRADNMEHVVRDLYELTD